MFDFDVGKLLVFGIVALAVIPAKDLPRVMRTVGQALGKMRRMAKDFQGQFMDAMREADLDNVKKELDGLKRDVEQEVKSLEQSAKLDASFDPAMAVHSELSHASEPPKEVGLSEVPLSAPAPAIMGPLAQSAPAETAPAQTAPAEAAAPRDAAE
jgi:sec-independent protein translocase protein TatB